MPTATKQFGFTSGAKEGWEGNTGGGTGVTVKTGTGADSPNDSTASGLIEVLREGKSLSNGNPYWEWLGTLEELGVPTGATITAINLDFDWNCWAYETGATSQMGPSELRNEAGALLGTFATASTFSATTGYATKSGTNITGLSLGADSKVRLRLNNIPKTGNSNKAKVATGMDWVVVTITYEEGKGSKLTLELNDSQAVSESRGTQDSIARSETQTTAETLTKTDAKVLTDAQTLAEAVGRAVGHLLNEAEVVADAQKAAAGKTLTEGQTLAEALAQATAKVLSDPQTLADLLAKQMGFAAADAQAVSDEISMTAGKEKPLEDAQGLAESIVAQVLKALAEGQALADTAALSLAHPSADAQSVSDSATWSAGKALGEILGSVEAESRAVGKRVDEAQVVSDSLARVWSALLGNADSVVVSDAVARSAAVDVPEALAAADLHSASLLRPLLESQIVVDLAQQTLALGLGESLALSEASTKAVGLVRAELVPLIDLVIVGGIMTLALEEAVNASESPQRASAHPLADSLGVQEGSLRGVGRHAAEIQALADELAASISQGRLINDQIAPLDSAQRALSLMRAEALVVLDVIAKTVALRHAEISALAEAFATSWAGVLGLADSTKVKDELTPALEDAVVDLIALVAITVAAQTRIEVALKPSVEIETLLFSQVQIEVFAAASVNVEVVDSPLVEISVEAAT